MRCVSILAVIVGVASSCWAQRWSPTRIEAEYYVLAYAQHYRVPVALVRAVVERESSWRVCAVSPKGAVGLMQLMPATAQRLRVRDRCNADQNISGGVRYLAWLMRRFHGDFRLVGCLLRRRKNCRPARFDVPEFRCSGVCIENQNQLPAPSCGRMQV